MRVTHVITRLIVGGAQENTVASVLGLQRKTNWNISLISGPSPGSEGSLAPAFDLRPGDLSIIPQLVRPIHPWKDALALKRLVAIFRQTRPDIVPTHSGKAGVLGRLAAARAKVPVIVHTIHGPSFGPFQGPAANWAFCAAERYTGRFTTHFVTVADAMTEQYLEAGIGRRGQYTKILSGFDLAPYASNHDLRGIRARLGLGADDIVIGKVARLFMLKGHEDLLAIAPALVRECPAIKFLLVGDGACRGALEEKARVLGLRERVIFAGLARPAEIPGLLAATDMVTHLSRREGLARALPQALAAGRPVVAYNCDGAREVCINDQTGFLVEPGNLAELKQRLLQLARDPALRLRLGNEGRRRVHEQFGVDIMIDRLCGLYLELAAAKGIPVT